MTTQARPISAGSIPAGPISGPNFETQLLERSSKTGAALSAHDEATLQVLLGDLAPTPSPAVDVALPPDQHVTDAATVAEYTEIEKAAVQLERDGQLDAARELVDALIAREPRYASAYNNRAQLRRLQTPGEADPGAVADLEKAIELASPASVGSPVSKMQASVLRNAYGQLAAIYLRQSDEPERANEAWDLQLRASDMLVQAGNYGEQIAAALAVSLNPYAKLCGNMMETVLQQYRP